MNRLNFKTTFFLFLYSAFYQLVELLDYYLIMKAFNIPVPFELILLFGSLTMLISEIPVTFLGLGSREAAILFFFSPFASLEKLLAAAILISFVEYILPNFLSLLWTKRFLDKMVK